MDEIEELIPVEMLYADPILWGEHADRGTEWLREEYDPERMPLLSGTLDGDRFEVLGWKADAFGDLIETDVMTQEQAEWLCEAMVATSRMSVNEDGEEEEVCHIPTLAEYVLGIGAATAHVDQVEAGLRDGMFAS